MGGRVFDGEYYFWVKMTDEGDAWMRWRRVWGRREQKMTDRDGGWGRKRRVVEACLWKGASRVVP